MNAGGSSFFQSLSTPLTLPFEKPENEDFLSFPVENFPVLPDIWIVQND